MFRTALSLGSELVTEENFQKLKNAGISAIEVSHRNQKHVEADRLPQFAAWAEQYGVELWSYHLPFWNDDINFDVSEPETADAIVERFCDLIEQGTAVGIRYFVVHPSREPIGSEERPIRMARAKKSLKMLAEFASQKGAVICVENLPRTCLGRNSAEILELISVHPELRVCFDTNHLLKEPGVDFVRALKDKIVTTHVSDYDFSDEKHWLPGEGLVDWQQLYHTLLEVGYHGVWLYELNFHADTIARSRDLIFEDCTRNAKEIFDGKPLTSLVLKS